MIGGGRRTHDFPHGRPRLLSALEAATVLGWFAWMLSAPSLVRSEALRWILSAVLVAPLFFAYTRLMNHYERTGLAVRLPNVRTWTKYDRLPAPVLAVRVSFFVIVTTMLVFGVVPMRRETSRIGIIACVLALFATGLLSVVLEQHYIRTGRAEEIPVDKK